MEGSNCPQRLDAESLCSCGSLRRWTSSEEDRADWLGEGWDEWAANFAAGYGHLETLKWIRANGGDWDKNALEWSSINGHLETIRWIISNGGRKFN